MDRAIGSKGYIGILNSLRTRHTDYGVVKLVRLSIFSYGFKLKMGDADRHLFNTVLLKLS